MRNTPTLPDWIRCANVPGYVAAHHLCHDETRLYGTESLHGDWDGQVLLLAKDFAPSVLVRDRVHAGDVRPYRHAPAMKTNRVLERCTEPVEHLGLLYGSALGNLLRDDGKVSGALPNRSAAIAYGKRVTHFVIDNMPELRFVMCMGQEAWEVATSVFEVAGDWREHRDREVVLGPLIAAYHSAARVSRERMEAPWRVLARCAA